MATITIPRSVFFLILLSAVWFHSTNGISPLIRQTSPADPSCEMGIQSGKACCASSCGTCGGRGCSRRPGGASSCCTSVINISTRICSKDIAPCAISSTRTSTSTSTKAVTSSSSAKWQNIDSLVSGRPQPRHEACFVMVSGRGFLLGGRGNRRVSIFDPKKRTWSSGAAMPLMMHHMQCVAYQNKVYIVSSWTGGYPREKNVDKIYIYDTINNSWTTRKGLSESRRRGGSASVLFDKKIYVLCGNRGGHGPPSKSLGWVDYYDIEKDIWIEKDIPNMPSPRDHTGGAKVGNEICVAGGRDGGDKKFFGATEASTWCLNPITKTWRNTNANLPDARAGAATFNDCQGRMWVAGGEGNKPQAFNQVHAFNGISWTRLPDLNRARHGTGLALSKCSCGQVFIASGSGRRGGSPELDSTEVYLPNGINTICNEY